MAQEAPGDLSLDLSLPSYEPAENGAQSLAIDKDLDSVPYKGEVGTLTEDGKKPNPTVHTTAEDEGPLHTATSVGVLREDEGSYNTNYLLAVQPGRTSDYRFSSGGDKLNTDELLAVQPGRPSDYDNIPGSSSGANISQAARDVHSTPIPLALLGGNEPNGIGDNGDSGSIPVPHMSALLPASSGNAPDASAPVAILSGNVPDLSALASSTQPNLSPYASSTQQTVDESFSSLKIKDTQDQTFGSVSPYEDFHKRLVLRPYQEEMVDRSLRGENDIILLPTGSGKTYVAIKVIIEHLNNNKEGNPKVVFFVPTAELANQQLEKIKDHLPLAWVEKAMKIIGESNIPAERLKEIIKGDEYAVLVVTPQIISNYFTMSSSASLSDFTLLVFDEYHHAKKDHPYNELIKRCLLSESDSPAARIPQLLGLTATIGIGDATTKQKAMDYIIGMCAKFGLKRPPSDSKEVYTVSQETVDEDYIPVKCSRHDGMSQHLQLKLMAVLEARIKEKLSQKMFAEHGASLAAIQFPNDRHNQVYEQFVVNLINTVTLFHKVEQLQESTNYCMVALEHLRVYYKALQLINLLHCEHGMKYIIFETDMRPVYRSIEDIWSLFTANKAELQRLQNEEDSYGENEKISALKKVLENLFLEKPKSKVIIFVRMRVVAQYMAELLCGLNPVFKAKELTSTGPSAEEAGMNPQQRYDALEGFEGNTYNILVATSLLEEGIDIQACNMVVRYMYVKDMIAKIQSRGRVRHIEGNMIALLDTKLRQQEERNAFREKLMYDALKEIRDMPNAQLKEKLTEQRKLLTPKKPPAPEKPRAKRSQAKISCKTCGFALGYMTDVRRYGQSHFLIIDGELCNKVTPYPDPTVMKPMDGMVPYGKLICKGNPERESRCDNRVGNLMKLDTGMHFGMWYIKGICVNNVPLKKYKEVESRHNIAIQPITAEELLEVGYENQFPTDRLEL